MLVSSVAEPPHGARLPLPGHAALAADTTFHGRYEILRVYTMRPDVHLGVFRRRDSRAVPADFQRVCGAARCWASLATAGVH